MTNKSAEEVLSDYVAEFGSKDGQIVRNLTDKISNLALQWGMFLYFFCGPRERVETLNEASGPTAKMIQGLLWDTTLMRVRQLTDPAKTKNNDNLSLGHLVRIAREARNIDISDAHKATLVLCQTSRAHATKHLAHLDLEHALGAKQTTVTRRQITAAIKAIGKFVQEFHLQVRNTDYVIMPLMNADNEQQFLLRLYQGNQAEKTFEAGARDAFFAGDWQAINRGDIPGWIREDRDLLDPF